jgi:hypothetical protein
MDLLVRLRRADRSRVRSGNREDISEEIAELEKRLGSFESAFSVKVIRITNDSTLEKLVSKILSIYSEVAGAIH